MSDLGDRLPRAIANKLRVARNIYAGSGLTDEQKWEKFTKAFKTHGLQAFNAAIAEKEEADPVQTDIELKRALEARDHIIRTLVDMVNKHSNDTEL